MAEHDTGRRDDRWNDELGDGSQVTPDGALGPGGSGQTGAGLAAGSDPDTEPSRNTADAENLTAGEGLGSLNDDANQDPLTRSAAPDTEGGSPDPEALGE